MKKNSKYESLKTIFFAIFIALLIRSFIAEPFNIPSGSMKPTLLKGDFLFVKKWSYGYSKHSLPFSLPLINNRIFYKEPIRGDVAVFKTPEDNKTDYIKRIIGLPGDKILLANGIVFLNNEPLSKMQIGDFTEKEISSLEAIGFMPVSIGQRILRAETAVISSISCIRTMTGGF